MSFGSANDLSNSKPAKPGKLPALPDSDDADTLRDWLTVALRPPAGYRVDRFERYGRQRPDPCTLTVRNGRDTIECRFTAQAELRGPQLRGNVLAAADGFRTPHLTPTEIENVWAALILLGAVIVDVDDRDETRKWIENLLDVAVPLRGHTLVPDGRHDALMAIRAQGQFVRPDALAMLRQEDDYRRPVRFVDKQTGEQWVRAGELATFLRWVTGVDRIAGSTLTGRLVQIGVEQVFFQSRSSPYPKLKLYRLTDELTEYVDGHLPEPEQEAMPF